MRDNRIYNMPIGIKLYEVIIVALFIAVCSIGVSRYLLSPIVSAVYFNPSDSSMGNVVMDDLKFDLIADVGLTMPGIELNKVMVLDDGYGRYRVQSTFNDNFTNDKEHVNFQIVRNGFRGDLTYLLKNKGHFKMPPRELNELSSFAANRVADYHNELNILPKSSYVDASFMLDKTITTEELYAKIEIYDELDIYWVAVQDSENLSLYKGENTLKYETGFKPKFLNTSYGDSPSEELYPAFFYGEYVYKQRQPHKFFASGMDEHFKSLLKYIIKREDYIGLTSNVDLTIKRYKDILNYVENKGVSVYKIYLRGTRDDILDFIEKETIYYWEINNVKISKYSETRRI